jgi:26S proteasome non-ATPase regulatory subunit 10
LFSHLACEEERIQEAGLLIKSGADSTLMNKEKLTPFDLAPADVQRILRKI